MSAGRWPPFNQTSSGGYVNDPESTAQTFADAYVFPGDQGYLDLEGRLHVLGRDDIINIGGYKVDRLEVETVIRKLLAVKDVFVLEGEQNGLPVIRAVIEADPACVTRSMVVAVCRQNLSRHKVPKQVVVRENLQRDANGKVIRSSLTKCWPTSGTGPTHSKVTFKNQLKLSIQSRHSPSNHRLSSLVVESVENRQVMPELRGTVYFVNRETVYLSLHSKCRINC